MTKEKSKQLVKNNSLAHIQNKVIVVIPKDYARIQDRFVKHNQGQLKVFLDSLDLDKIAQQDLQQKTNNTLTLVWK